MFLEVELGFISLLKRRANINREQCEVLRSEQKYPSSGKLTSEVHVMNVHVSVNVRDLTNVF